MQRSNLQPLPNFPVGVVPTTQQAQQNSSKVEDLPMQILEAGDTPTSAGCKTLVDVIVVVTGPAQGTAHQDAAAEIKAKCAQQGLHPLFVHVQGKPDLPALKSCMEGRISPYTALMCITTEHASQQQQGSQPSERDAHNVSTLQGALTSWVGVKKDGSAASFNQPVYIKANVSQQERDKIADVLAPCKDSRLQAFECINDAYVSRLKDWLKAVLESTERSSEEAESIEQKFRRERMRACAQKNTRRRKKGPSTSPLPRLTWRGITARSATRPCPPCG